MHRTISYPHSKVFVDCDNRLVRLRYTEPDSQPVIESLAAGDALVALAALDEELFQAKLSEVTKILDADDHSTLAWQEITEKIYDVLAVFKDSGYAYEYLKNDMARLLESLQGEVECSIELGDFYPVLLDVYTQLKGIHKLKQQCRYMVRSCLDEDIYPNIPHHLRMWFFRNQYNEYDDFFFATQYEIMPTKKGRLDTDRLRQMVEDGLDTRLSQELRINAGHAKGMSLAPYYYVDSLVEMLFLDFYECLKLGFTAKRCELCGRYFLKRKHNNQIYCKRIWDKEKTCGDAGPKMKRKNDPVTSEYDHLRNMMMERRDRTVVASFWGSKEDREAIATFGDWGDYASARWREYKRGKMPAEEMLRQIKSRIDEPGPIDSLDGE